MKQIFWEKTILMHSHSGDHGRYNPCSKGSTKGFISSDEIILWVDDARREIMISISSCYDMEKQGGYEQT